MKQATATTQSGCGRGVPGRGAPFGFELSDFAIFVGGIMLTPGPVKCKPPATAGCKT